MAAQLQLGTGATPTVALVFAGAPGIAVVAAPVLRLTGEYTYAALTAAFPSPPLGMQVVISDSTTNAQGANITTGGLAETLCWPGTTELISRLSENKKALHSSLQSASRSTSTAWTSFIPRTECRRGNGRRC